MPVEKQFGRIFSKQPTDCINLTVAMQKEKLWKISSRCYRLRYNIYGKTIKGKTSHKEIPTIKSAVN